MPTASHDRILLKASFTNRQDRAPLLRLDGKKDVAGSRTDSAGNYWRFDATQLQPGHEYRLEMLSAQKKPLCDPWPLRTMPAPDDSPRAFRVLFYTCAGGDERVRTRNGPNLFLSLARRQAMLNRAMTFAPDAIVGNGDHIYWDLRQTGSPPGMGEDILKATGRFIRDLPVMGTQNEEVLKRVGEAQIGKLYGTRFRSTPVFFLQDDHDYFENDDANAQMVTYPPDHLMVQLGRGMRRMFYPEYLPDENRPSGLPGASWPDAPPGVGESFGTLRFGTLAEILLFDCRRFLTLAGPNAVIVPRETENWLTARMKDSRVSHVVNVPSMPPVWSAGKWGDWYPDILGKDGKLTTQIPKPYWQRGWSAQHDRLMQATSAMPERVPLWISGDMHAHGEARLLRAGSTDLSHRPVTVRLSGAISTLNGWPSGVRGTPPKPSAHVEVEEKLAALEENGFLIVDFTSESIAVRAYKWSPREADSAIAAMTPFHRAEYRRA